MRTLLILVLSVSLLPTLSRAQSSAVASAAYQEGASLYIAEDYDAALAAVRRGLRAEPNNGRLKDLRDLLLQEQQQQNSSGSKSEEEEEEKEQEGQQDQQEGEQDQQQQDGEQNQDGQQQDGQQPQDQEEGQQQNQNNPEQGEEEREGEKEEAGAEENPNETQAEGNESQEEDPDQAMSREELQKRLEELGLTPEKAQMILDAMQANEIQYLQQMKRNSNREVDPRKPDW